MITRWKITILQLFFIVLYRIRMRVKSEKLLWSTILYFFFAASEKFRRILKNRLQRREGRLYDPDTRNRGSSVPTILLCM